MAISENPFADTPKLEYTDIMSGQAGGEILQALREYSFFYITNIPNFDPQDELNLMKSFFNKPEEVKEKYATLGNNPKNSNIIRGLTFKSSVRRLLFGDIRFAIGDRFILMILPAFLKLMNYSASKL